MHRFDLTHTPRLLRFTTEESYLSVAIDWALILGERWWEGSPRSYRGFGSVPAAPLDLRNPVLRRAAADLSGGYLRVGGSESDRMVFERGGAASWRGGAPGRGFGVAEPQRGTAEPQRGTAERRAGASEPQRGTSGRRECPSVLTEERWREVADFSRAVGLPLFVTVSAGRCSRDRDGRWRGDSFARWIDAAVDADDPVAVWELGNEVNGFPFIFGPRTRVTSAQYTEDYRSFREIAREGMPGVRCAGPAAAVWPILGEPGPIMSGVSKRLGSDLDILSWHYYPFQSRRGRLATRRWKSSVRRQTLARGSARYRAARVRRYARRSGVPRVWLSETGHALFGGEPGRSDRYMAGLWWLDHLGAMAQEGTAGVVRQALVGGDYGLLSIDGMQPRPDYWLSLLWRAVMGPKVYDLEYLDPLLRVYCHSPATVGRTDAAGARDGTVSDRGTPGPSSRGWVVINSDTDAPARLAIPAGSDGWLVEGEASDTSVLINEQRLGPDTAPEMRSVPAPTPMPRTLMLPPLAIAFIRT